jgi:MPBQ/MSBQ methyltransferase
MGRLKDDPVLRIFNEVLRLERLHYGLWTPEEEVSFEQLKIAQKRYEDFLIENIPNGAKRVLDVGCGTGMLAEQLKNRGYDVEALSPDINQKEIVEKRGVFPFHLCCFEDFSPDGSFDCIVMSESSQYIRLPLLFKVAARSLAKDRYLLISDYFTLPGATGALSKSGHDYAELMAEAKSERFELITEKDITNEVAKTLDLARLYTERLMRAAEIYESKLRKSHPYLVGLGLWLFRNKIKTWKGQLDLIDSNKFKETKAYRVLLFRLEG